METKPLLFGLIGFFIGGLLVSIAATTFDKPETNMSQMTSSLERKTGDEFDEAFIADMIEHHQTAVDMSKLSATNAKHSEVKQLSKDIVAAQEDEIKRMRQWQKDWGYSAGKSNTNSQH